MKGIQAALVLAAAEHAARPPPQVTCGPKLGFGGHGNVEDPESESESGAQVDEESTEKNTPIPPIPPTPPLNKKD